MMFEKTYSCYH